MRTCAAIVLVLALASCKDKAPKQEPVAAPPPVAVEGCAGYAKLLESCAGENALDEEIAACNDTLDEHGADTPVGKMMRSLIACAKSGTATCEQFGACTAKVDTSQVAD